MIRLRPGHVGRQGHHVATVVGILGLLAALALALAGACAPAAAPEPTPTPTVTSIPLAAVPVPIGGAFDLQPGQQTTVAELGRVKLVRVVEDSRCPQDVTCVWAGQATVDLAVGEDRQEVEIVSSTGAVGEAASVDYGGHQITVVELQPFPHSERAIDPDDYIVTLAVTLKPDEPAPRPTPMVSGGLIIREIPIASVEVLILESFPYQIHLRVQGNLQDGCSKLHDVQQERQDNTVRVSITSERPKDVMCTAVAPPYEETVPLEGGFLPGDYTVTVNGVDESFTL